MSVQDLLPELADPRGEYVDVSDVSDSDSDATQEWEPAMVNAQRAGECDCPANVASSEWHPSLAPRTTVILRLLSWQDKLYDTDM